MDNIFHITSETAWSDAMSAGTYEHRSLHDEGFIHMSSRAQVVATTSRYYSGEKNMVLLEVDPSLLADDSLVWEASVVPETSIPGDRFPHYYGALPLRCVVAVHEWSSSMANPPQQGSHGRE